MKKALVGIFVACLIGGVAVAQEEAPAQTLITNVQIFDGVNEERMADNVLVEGNLIKQVSAKPISAPNATVIDGGGGTLMPGLIEAHAHLSLHGDLFETRNDLNWMYVGAKSGAEATHMLIRLQTWLTFIP